MKLMRRSKPLTGLLKMLPTSIPFALYNLVDISTPLSHSMADLVITTDVESSYCEDGGHIVT